jgi:tetrapyrrole methylase family protein/MazG family protein
MSKKKLIITGCGIKSLAHLTRENKAAIEQADLVLYLVNEPIVAQWIQNKSKENESLENLYFSESLRVNAYKKIIDHILCRINRCDNVCVVVYGHPLLLSNSIEHLIRQIDRNVIDLIIIPAISTFDCLLADLEIDPLNGCFSVEANELINKNKHLDPTNHLIIWQVGLIEDAHSKVNSNLYGVKALKEKLLRTYDLEHECVLYESSIYPHIPCKKIKTLLFDIEQVPISRITTAYLPPIPSSTGRKSTVFL